MMEDDLRDNAVFEMNAFSTLDASLGYPPRSSETSADSVQNYDYLSARDVVDSIRRELTDLHENLLKMSVRAHVLEVDLATQFNPDTVLDVKQVEMTCRECTQVVEKTAADHNTTDTTRENDSSYIDASPQDHDQDTALKQEYKMEEVIRGQ